MRASDFFRFLFLCVTDDFGKHICADTLTPAFSKLSLSAANDDAPVVLKFDLGQANSNAASIALARAHRRLLQFSHK